MIVTTKQLYDVAYGRFALGAYNVNNMEQVLGLFRGNTKVRAPFIAAISKGARKYGGPGMIETILHTAMDQHPDLVFAIHLDHGDEETCYDAIESGLYSSVMIDASHASLDENIEITRRVVRAAHDAGVSVEAELGMLGGVEEDIQVDEKHAMLTDPDEAARFVRETGCDSLAVAVGTSHGAYKFSGAQGLHFERIREIQKRLPGFPLVLHGASTVPADEVERINAAGGALRTDAKGVDPMQLPEAIRLGVCKINVDTDGRLIWTRVHREAFRHAPADFDLRPIGKTFMQDFGAFVETHAAAIGAAGQLDYMRRHL